MKVMIVNMNSEAQELLLLLIRISSKVKVVRASLGSGFLINIVQHGRKLA